jgi:RecJ-like exonuclease
MQTNNTIMVTVYGRAIEHQWAFPARWIICQACDGHATTTAHIEPDGGGFTASEWRDACDENEDFEHDYFSGAYDRPCPSCAGKGRVQVIDTERVTSWRDKIVLKEFKRQERDSAEIDAMHEAERRMGA